MLPRTGRHLGGRSRSSTVLTYTVPGIFFDLNPAKRRDLFDSPCHHFVRLSYGPRSENLSMGLDGIERVINKHKSKK